MRSKFERAATRGSLLALCALMFFGCADRTEVPSERGLELRDAAGRTLTAQEASELCNGPLSTVLQPVPPSDGGGPRPVDVKVHYNRPDGAYTGWGLHLWQVDEGGQYIGDYPGVTWPAPLSPAGFDSYGAYFLIEASKFTNPAAAGFGFLVHRGDEKDPDGDRRWSFETGNEFWLKSGDSAIYRSNPLSGTLDIATVRVTYKRTDAAYGNWGLHLWNGSGVDVSRLAGLTLEQWDNPVPLSSMPNYVAASDGSEISFDLPVTNPISEPGREAVEFIIHGLPGNPDGGVNNKDGWNNNIRVTYSSLSITNQTGNIWLVQQVATVFTSNPETSLVSTTDARAVWLGRGLLRWPGTNAAGTFKLAYSAQGQIIARRAQIRRAFIDEPLQVGPVLRQGVIADRVLHRHRDQRRDEGDQLLALPLLGCLVAGDREGAQGLATLSGQRMQKVRPAAVTVLRGEVLVLHRDGELRVGEPGLGHQRRHRRVQGDLEIEIALHQAVDAVGDAQARGLAIQRGARLLELVIALEQGLMRLLELTGGRDRGERPGDRAPDLGEQRRAVGDHDAVARPVWQPGHRHLGARRPQEHRHLLEVADGDDEEVPAHRVALGQQQIDLDLVGRDVSLVRPDAGEDLVADAVARLVGPAIEVHRGEQHPGHHEGKAQGRHPVVRAADLHVLVIREVLAQVPHDDEEVAPVDALLLVAQVGSRQRGAGDRVLHRDALVLQGA